MWSYHLATSFPQSDTKLFPLLGVLLVQENASSFYHCPSLAEHAKGWYTTCCSYSYKCMFTNAWNELEYRYHMCLTTHSAQTECL